MRKAVLLGLDLGTSGLKGVALDEEGRVLAHARSGYPTARPEPGAAEHDPADWIAAAARVTADLKEALERTSTSWVVRGIGLSGMLPTLVTVDRRGAALGPAITWQDGRAEREGEELRELAGPDAVYASTGQWLDGRYLVPMFLRLLRTDPGRAAGTVRLAGAKDHVLAWLTGEHVTDPSTAAGFGCFRLSGGLDEGVIAAAGRLGGGRALPHLPTVMDATTTFPLRRDVAAALGLPAETLVAVGGADSVLAAFGLGATGTGDVAYVAGTSTVILASSPVPIIDSRHRYLVTPLAGPAGWGLEMDLVATGSAIRWLRGMLGLADEAAVMALAAEVPAGREPTFLPYLGPGEQGALWDPGLSGTIHGLTLDLAPRHLARALLTGILVESRRCLDVLSASGAPGVVHVAGSAATDPTFLQDLADASGRPVRRHAGSEADASAVGAARLAALALVGPWPLGPQPSARDLAAPRTDRADLWAEIGRRHDALRIAVRAGGEAR